MAYFNVDAAKKAGFSDKDINDYIKKNNLQAGSDSHYQQSQPKSVTGFLNNVGSDIGSTVKGIASLPGVIGQLFSGQVGLGDVASGVGKGIYNEYKDLATKPLDTAYNKPISSILDVLPFLQLGKAALVGKTAGEVGDVGKLAEVAGNAGNEAGNVGKNINNISKVAEGLSNTSENAKYIKPTVAENAYLSQFNGAISPNRVKDLDPIGTVRSMLDHKIGGSLEDIGNTATTVTGENGLVTKLQRKAIGNIKGEINIPDTSQMVKDSLGNIAELTPNEQKRIISAINRNIPKGATPDTANALDTFDKVKNLENLGHQYLSKSAGNIRLEQIGKTYLDVADELKQAIEGGVGADKGVEKIVTPELLKQAESISPKLAEDLKNAKSISDLRKIQSPFVRIQKMIDLKRQSQFASAQNLASNVEGLGKLIPSVTDPLAFLKPVLSSPEVNTRAASTLDALSGVLGKGKQIAGNVGKVVANTAKNPVAIDLARQLGDIQPQESQTSQSNVPAGWDPETYANFKAANPNLEPNAEDTQRMLGTDNQSKSGIPQITSEDLQRARLSLSDANFAKVKQLYDLQQGAGGQNLTEQQQARKDSSDLAKKAYNAILNNPKLDVGVVSSRKNELLGKLGLANQDALDFLTTVSSLKATIAKARAGTSFTPNEEKLLNKYTPNDTDSKQELQTKLKGLIEFFNSK